MVTHNIQYGIIKHVELNFAYGYTLKQATKELFDHKNYHHETDKKNRRCTIINHLTNKQNTTHSQGKLAKNLKQISYQNMFVPLSCISSGLATHNLFTLDIHRIIFRRVISKMADYLT